MSETAGYVYCIRICMDVCVYKLYLPAITPQSYSSCYRKHVKNYSKKGTKMWDKCYAEEATLKNGTQNKLKENTDFYMSHRQNAKHIQRKQLPSERCLSQIWCSHSDDRSLTTRLVKNGCDMSWNNISQSIWRASSQASWNSRLELLESLELTP